MIISCILLTIGLIISILGIVKWSVFILMIAAIFIITSVMILLIIDIVDWDD